MNVTTKREKHKMKRARRQNAGVKPKRFRSEQPDVCITRNVCHKYPCTICENNCVNGVIECSTCLRWTHSKCLAESVSSFQISDWENQYYSFHCPKCTIKDNTYDIEGALMRYVSFLIHNLWFFFLLIQSNK